MGLFSWIKLKHYENVVSSADKKANAGEYYAAENKCKKLLEKYPPAVAHLAHLYVLQSDNDDRMLRYLKEIVELEGYVKETESYDDFKKELNAQIASIEETAANHFTKDEYAAAEHMANAISTFKSDSIQFVQNHHRYKAYSAFVSSFLSGNFYKKDFLDKVVNELKKSGNCNTDIKALCNKFEAKGFYARAIFLLLQFGDCENYRDIYGYVRNVIDKKDKEIKNIKSIADICEDSSTCIESARFLKSLAEDISKKKKYSEAITYSDYAAEFLKDDKSFQYERCSYRLLNLPDNATPVQVKSFIDFVSDANIEESKKKELFDKLYKWAKSLNPAIAVRVCKLESISKESRYILLYLQKALEQAKSNYSALDFKEVKSTIDSYYDEDNRILQYGAFAKVWPSFDSPFFDSSINKIKQSKQSSLFCSYWNIKRSVRFINELVSDDYVDVKNLVTIIADNIESLKFDGIDSKAFFKAITQLADEEFAIKTLYSLIDKFSAVQFYHDKVLSVVDKKQKEDAISLLQKSIDTPAISGNLEIWTSLVSKKCSIEVSDIENASSIIKVYKEYATLFAGKIENEARHCTPGNAQYLAFWETYGKLLLERSESQPKEKAVRDLGAFIADINKYCPYETVAKEKEIVEPVLAKHTWNLASEYEADIEYKLAIKFYEQLSSGTVATYVNRAELRALICYLKDGKLSKSVEQRIENALNFKSFQSLREDLAYRYSCYLLRETRPHEAESILKTFLPDENDLAELCKNIIIKEAEDCLSEFNSKVERIEKNEMSAKDAEKFLSELGSYKSRISSILTDTKSQFDEYCSKIESYILKQYFDEELYEEAFDYIIGKHPDFINDDNAFRNLAIASLGIIDATSDHKCSEDKYKKAISIWISAIYTDALFVKSLDYTLWDDAFTFTLQDSLGNEFGTLDDIPDNVNDDEPIDNQNISIKETQTSLLTRMESAISKNHPQFEAFFASEKKALEDLVEIRLDQKCNKATPYLAKWNRAISQNVKSAFDYELTQDYGNHENVMRIGVLYGFSDGVFAEYANVQSYADSCRLALKRNSGIKAAFDKISQIRDYDSLFESLRADVETEMDRNISDNVNYDMFLKKFEPICIGMKNATLSLKCSNYVNAKIIGMLNDDTMDLRDGVKYMVRLYIISPSNVTVKQNVEGMLEGLAARGWVENNSADKEVVEKAVRDTGNTFKNVVEDAKVQAQLSKLIDDVNSHRIEESSAIVTLYNLYTGNRNNARLCENLVTLCDICIHKYIIADSYSPASMKDVLNKLSNSANRSSTFNSKASKLRESYNNIWSQLTWENRSAMTNGTNLNSKGWALKRGLDYLKKIGGVTGSGISGLDSIFGSGLFG